MEGHYGVRQHNAQRTIVHKNVFLLHLDDYNGLPMAENQKLLSRNLPFLENISEFRRWLIERFVIKNKGPPVNGNGDIPVNPTGALLIDEMMPQEPYREVRSN